MFLASRCIESYNTKKQPLAESWNSKAYSIDHYKPMKKQFLQSHVHQAHDSKTHQNPSITRAHLRSPTSPSSSQRLPFTAVAIWIFSRNPNTTKKKICTNAEKISTREATTPKKETFHIKEDLKSATKEGNKQGNTIDTKGGNCVDRGEIDQKFAGDYKNGKPNHPPSVTPIDHPRQPEIIA
ncbi:hypothetical protein Droror1_Dr00008942 [Drosera rotundifolia]